MLGVLFAILVAIFWSLGEVSYSKISKKHNNSNVYFYTFLLRSIIYLGVVLLFRRNLFATFSISVFSAMLPIIFCDLFASIVVNIADSNGKLSVVSPIMASYPILDILLGVILLKEKCSIIQLLLVFLISISIIVLATNQKKTEKAPHPVKGIIFSILYMLLVACSTYFEKTIYINNHSIYDLYYYKGMIYSLATIFFLLKIVISKQKIIKPEKEVLKGCGLTPIGNILYSYALTFGSMSIITPISSLYSVITNFISRFILKEKTTIIERVFIAIILLSTLFLIVL